MKSMLFPSGQRFTNVFVNHFNAGGDPQRLQVFVNDFDRCCRLLYEVHLSGSAAERFDSDRPGTGI